MSPAVLAATVMVTIDACSVTSSRKYAPHLSCSDGGFHIWRLELREDRKDLFDAWDLQAGARLEGNPELHLDAGHQKAVVQVIAILIAPIDLPFANRLERFARRRGRELDGFWVKQDDPERLHKLHAEVARVVVL